MTWKTPRTEQEWAYCLSRYLDGDLSGEEQGYLESLLSLHPVRKRQLESLRCVTASIQAWQIPAPEPSIDFMHAYVEEVSKHAPKKMEWPWRVWPALQFGNFSLGWIAGMVFLFLIQYTGLINEKPRIIEPHQDKPVMNLLISSDQAQTLLKEVKAESIIRELRKYILSQNWDAAQEAYHQLHTNYAGTKVILQMRKDPILKWIVQRYENKGV